MPFDHLTPDPDKQPLLLPKNPWFYISTAAVAVLVAYFGFGYKHFLGY